MDRPSNKESASPLTNAFVPPPEDTNQGGKHVRWTPSVTGGSSTSGSPPESPNSYQPTLDTLPERHHEESEAHDLTPPDLGTFDVSQEPNSAIYGGHPGPELYPSAPPPTAGMARHGHVLTTNAMPPHASMVQATPMHPVELTNAMIAKVQKHCRFAISSLDYEDAEQARKELREALALLGG